MHTDGVLLTAFESTTTETGNVTEFVREVTAFTLLSSDAIKLLIAFASLAIVVIAVAAFFINSLLPLRDTV